METVKYLVEAPPKKIAKNPLRDDDKKDDPAEEPEDDEELGDGDEFKEDFEIRFARDLLTHARLQRVGGNRHRLGAPAGRNIGLSVGEEPCCISPTTLKP